MLYLNDYMKRLFVSQSETTLFPTLMSLQGENFRHQEGRQTQRLQLNHQDYFIKQHRGIGWMEIIKNLLQLKLPVISAKNEWQAITKLNALQVNVPSIAGFGYQGWNPAKRQSFILMEAILPSISLEDFCKTWQQTPPNFSYKQQLIAKVALIARTMHQNGINHRDFYLCHFLMDLKSAKEIHNTRLFLIDLHRAQLRHKTPLRWIIKDLAGLYFSSKNIGLTSRDYFRFMKTYCAKGLREIFATEKHNWEKVKTRGEQLYRHHT